MWGGGGRRFCGCTTLRSCRCLAHPAIDQNLDEIFVKLLLNFQTDVVFQRAADYVPFDLDIRVTRISTVLSNELVLYYLYLSGVSSQLSE